MAGVSQTPDGLNVELNLVPFIDLLSSLVLFLLLSAVWIQISAIQASVDSKGKAVVEEVKPPERLAIKVTKEGLSLVWPAKISQGKPSFLERLPEGKELEQLVTILTPLISTKALNLASIAGTDDIEYGELIRVLDLVKKTGVESVAIATN